MTVFLVVGAVGIVLVLATFVIGDLFDGLLHLDALDNDLFSISSLAAFIGAFGFGGALGLTVIDHVAVAAVAGLVTGFLATYAAVRLTKALKASENQASFRSESLLGHSGRVITSIPGDGYGEISVNAGGQIRKFNAKASHPIEPGAEVWVSAILSPTAVEVTATSSPPPLS